MLDVDMNGFVFIGEEIEYETEIFENFRHNFLDIKWGLARIRSSIPIGGEGGIGSLRRLSSEGAPCKKI